MKQTDARALTGGCLCGRVRYTVNAPLRDVAHCHCSMCRKAHGAAFVSFSVVADDAFQIDQGEDDLIAYESSPGTRRMFCHACGSHVMDLAESMRGRRFLMLGTLDPGADPGHDRAHEKHIFWESRASWYEVKDELPKCEGYGE